MPAAMKQCSSCGNDFRGGSRAAYCSATCRQRARRARIGRNRDKGDTPPVTVATATGVRSAQARAVLDGLDAELAANAEQLGQQLEWSAAERAIRDLIADTVDRRTDLLRLYRATDDGALMVKLSAELRLLETSLARLLKQVKTELPAADIAEVAEGTAGCEHTLEGRRGCRGLAAVVCMRPAYVFPASMRRCSSGSLLGL